MVIFSVRTHAPSAKVNNKQNCMWAPRRRVFVNHTSLCGKRRNERKSCQTNTGVDRSTGHRSIKFVIRRILREGTLKMGSHWMCDAVHSFTSPYTLTHLKHASHGVGPTLQPRRGSRFTNPVQALQTKPALATHIILPNPFLLPLQANSAHDSAQQQRNDMRSDTF